MEDFICLESMAGTYSNAMRTVAICKENLSDIERNVPEDINILILSEVECNCRDNVAHVAEHYDLAETDPARIFVRKRIADELEQLDFTTLCELFLKEMRFSVQEVSSKEKMNKGCSDRKYWKGSYGTTPEQYKSLFAQVKNECGEILPFFQSMVVQDMIPLFLTADSSNQSSLQQILEEIDDDILCGTGCVDTDVLLKIFSLKYGEDMEEKVVYRSGKLKYHNLAVVPLKEIPFVITEIKRVKGKFNIIGTVLRPLENSEIEYYFMDNKNKRYELKLEDGEDIVFLGEKLHTRKKFIASLPVGSKPVGMRFMYSYQGMYQARVRMEFAENLEIVPDTKCNFRIQDGYLLKAEKRILFIAPLRKKTRIKLFFTFPWKSIKMYIAKER